MENTGNNNQASIDNGKTVAIVAYITLIGWIVAFVMNSNNKTALGTYHIRQMLGLMILSVVVAIIRFPLFFIPFIGWGIGSLLSLAVLVLWLLGLISAANEQQKPIPILGETFQKWFATVG